MRSLHNIKTSGCYARYGQAYFYVEKDVEHPLPGPHPSTTGCTLPGAPLTRSVLVTNFECALLNGANACALMHRMHQVQYDAHHTSNTSSML